MCIEDWRLGRLIRTKITPFTLTFGTTTSINASMQRVGVRVSIATPAIVIPNGFTIAIDGNLVTYVFSSVPSVIFTLASDGDLPTKSFLITNISSATTLSGAIIEYFLPEEYIQAGVDSFKSQYKFGS